MTDSQSGSDSSELPGHESPGEGELQPSQPIFPDAAPDVEPVGDDVDGKKSGQTDEIAGDVVASESAEAELELGVVVLGKVTFGVALHVDDTQLVVGVGKQALDELQQSGEVILDGDEDTTQTSFDETA